MNFHTEHVLISIFIFEICFFFFMNIWKLIENNDIEGVKSLIDADKSISMQEKEDGTNCLIASAISGNLDLVNYFIKLGLNPTGQTNSGSDALYGAAMSGNEEVFNYFLDKGLDISRKRPNNTSIIFFAAIGGNISIMQKCIDAGLNINEKTPGGSSPLLEAARKNRTEMCHFLLEKGADPLVQLKTGFNILNAAAKNGNVDLFNTFSKYFTLLRLSRKPSTLVHDAVISHSLDILSILVKNKFNINEEMNGRLPIHLAAAAGDLSIVRFLIENGAKQIPDEKENLPLHYASESGNMQLITYLLEQGEDINARNILGLTPIQSAAAAHQFDVVNFLLVKGADINQVDNKNRNVLHFACSHCDANFVDTCSTFDVEIDKEDEDGYTPLFSAVIGNNIELVKELIRLGCDVKHLSKNGESLMHFLPNDTAMVDFLISQGLSIDSKTNIGRTPIHYAAEKGYKKLLTYLIDKGADPFVADDDGVTSDILASENGHFDLFETLLDYVPQEHNEEKQTNNEDNQP